MSSTSPSGTKQAEHNTSPITWLACAVIIAGSVVSAVALIEWVWPWFWVGVGLMVGGSIFGWAVGIMDQVSEFHPPAADASGGSGG